jgi:ADP-ribose pyrophosphatase
MPAEEWEQLGSEPAFADAHFHVRRDTLRLPGGRVVDDYLVGVLEDYALVVAVTTGGDVVLTRQWKQGVRRVTLELPGGKLDDGETPAEAAARELREETGYAAATLEPLASLDVDASKAANQGHIFLALGVELRHTPEPHEMEAPDVVLVPLADVTELITSGKICGAASVAGLLLARSRGGDHAVSGADP